MCRGKICGIHPTYAEIRCVHCADNFDNIVTFDLCKDKISGIYPTLAEVRYVQCAVDWFKLSCM